MTHAESSSRTRFKVECQGPTLWLQWYADADCAVADGAGWSFDVENAKLLFDAGCAYSDHHDEWVQFDTDIDSAVTPTCVLNTSTTTSITTSTATTSTMAAPTEPTATVRSHAQGDCLDAGWPLTAVTPLPADWTACNDMTHAESSSRTRFKVECQGPTLWLQWYADADCAVADGAGWSFDVENAKLLFDAGCAYSDHHDEWVQFDTDIDSAVTPTCVSTTSTTTSTATTSTTAAPTEPTATSMPPAATFTTSTPAPPATSTAALLPMIVPKSPVPCGHVPQATCSKDDQELCVYDATCSSLPPRRGGLGCNAGGVGQNCRFCGFKHYLACDAVLRLPQTTPACSEVPSPVCAGPSEPCYLDNQCVELPPALQGLGCNAGGISNCRFCGFDNFVECPTQVPVVV